jgi:hypothetical protein
MPDNQENPYESPQTELNSVKPLAGRVLTENMLFYLRAASPWLRFIGIAGFIYLGLMAVNFLTVIVAVSNVDNVIPGLGALGSSFFLGFLLFFEAILFFPTFFIFQFGRKIRAYLHSGEEGELEQAFKNNKSLWTFIGVLTMFFVVITSIIVLTTVITIIASTAF